MRMNLLIVCLHHIVLTCACQVLSVQCLNNVYSRLGVINLYIQLRHESISLIQYSRFAIGISYVCVFLSSFYTHLEERHPILAHFKGFPVHWYYRFDPSLLVS